MKKELTISAKFDTSDFDKSVERMQNKLKDLYAPSDMARQQQMTDQRLRSIGMGDARSGVSSEQYQKTTLQVRRELDGFIKSEVKEQEKLTKIIQFRVDSLNKMKEQQKQAVKDSKEELELREKISRVEENSFRLKESYKQRESTINSAMDARNKVAPRDIPGLIESFKGGGFKHGMSQIPGAFGQNPWGMGGAAVGMMGAGIGAASEFYRDWKGMPIRSELSMGSAVQGTFGRDASNIYGRRTAFEQNFQPERQRAAQQAIENSQANRNADRGSLAGNLASIGGGAAITASTGGLGALAGIGLAGKGLYGMMSDERQRSLMLSPFSSTSNNRYESMIGEQMGKDYSSSYDAQKSQNPFKTQAVGEYEQNYMRNLGAQRQMGLGNQGFYGAGGFLRSNISQGFTGDMGLEMSSAIGGAGGSTRMQRDSVFGNQLARGGMTNAGSVLGGLSGGIGSSEGTKQATIKILAEGMKQGLDDSKFAEENRRFTQAAAEIITRSGANGESDFARNAKNFSSFMGENTNKGIEAAKSAYEQYQQISTSTTGPRGVMRAAGFMKDKYLSQLSTIEKTALMQVPEEQLNENNPLVSGLAEKSGTSATDFIGRIRGVNQGSVSRFKEADGIRDRLKSKGIDVGRTGDPGYLKSLSSQDRADVTQLMSFQTSELGYQGQREMVSRAAGTVGKPDQYGPGVGDLAVQSKIGAPSGRMEDNTIAAMAGDASTVLKNFNEMRGGMDAAAKSASQFTDQIRELNAQLQAALEEARTGKGGSGINNILKKMAQVPGGTQTQAGKQSK